MYVNAQTNGKEARFSATVGGNAKVERAKALCAALLNEFENKDSKFAVEKYLGELATELGGSFTPAP